MECDPVSYTHLDVYKRQGERKVVKQQSPVQNPVLWSTENPYLYKLASMIKRGKSTTCLLYTSEWTGCRYSIDGTKSGALPQAGGIDG